MRELTDTETGRLEECLRELACHHNEVSAHFRGLYPRRPVPETLAAFAEDLRSGRSRIAAVEEGDRILGFCKTDLVGTEGTVAYLVVLREARGKGYGGLLMDWALDALRRDGACSIEVKVVDGNDAVGFYEKYGFRINARILRMNV